MSVGLVSLGTCKCSLGVSLSRPRLVQIPTLVRFPKSDPGWRSVRKEISLVGSPRPPVGFDAGTTHREQFSGSPFLDFVAILRNQRKNEVGVAPVGRSGPGAVQKLTSSYDSVQHLGNNPDAN